jgi:hypothetical protein
MAALVYEMRRAVSRLECSSCGAEANASCDCGKPYVPAKVRAVEAIKANPEKSDRAIAADLGVSPMTVGRARAGVTDGTPDEDRIGLDGKKYPAKPRTPKGYYDEPADEPEDPENHVTACWLRIDAARNLSAVQFNGKATQELVDAARAVASAWEATAQKLEERL